MFESTKKLALGTMTALSLTISAMTSQQAQAQTEPCLGQVAIFAATFCPRGWINADGQLLSIVQYSALFSIWGTQYGGDGRTTFGVPNLKSRSVVSYGRGTGLNSVGREGTTGGSDTIQLTTTHLPQHRHNVRATNSAADGSNPSNNTFARNPDTYHLDEASNRVNLDSRSIGNTGGNQSITKRMPYQVLRYCAAQQGIFCSRS